VTATVTETAKVTPTIYYDVTESRLVLVTVTATDARVCGVLFLNDLDPLKALIADNLSDPNYFHHYYTDG
jgi:hypothetical protein